MSRVFVITDGERNCGYDPCMTDEGKQQVAALQPLIYPFREQLKMILIGTGTRFSDSYWALEKVLADIPLRYSPFCGTANCNVADESLGRRIALRDCNVSAAHYFSIIGTPGFDAWTFLAYLPNSTLLCAGEELMCALGIKSEKGNLYELIPVNKSCRKIAS